LEELTLGSRRHRQLLHSPPPPSLHPNRVLGTASAPDPTAAASAAAGAAVAAVPAGAAVAMGAAVALRSSNTAQQQPQQQAGGAKLVSLPSGGWPTVYNPWMGTIQLWSGACHPPLALIPRPPQQQQAFIAQQQPLLQPQLQLYQLPAAPPGASEVSQWGPVGSYNPMVDLPSWDTQSLASAFSTTTLNQPSSSE
jgi:hypothetical protein